MRHPLSVGLFLSLIISFLTLITKDVSAQCSPGTITKSHANSSFDAMLDPDGDGYITESGSNFTSGTTEMLEFELLPNSTTGWIEIQDVGETDSDITPNCGNPDLIQDDNGGDFAYFNIIDPTPATPTSGDEFILFRFRLAKSPNGNFGYNFLVDSDAAFGTGVDVNSTCGNLGFEREIQFANAGGKKGVSVYDVDGSISYNATLCSQCINIDDVQEACAASSGNCGTSDPQFLTFPLPLSYLNVGSNVSMANFFVALATASSGNATSVLGGGNVTDMGALDGGNSGCPCSGLSGCALFDCETECINVAFNSILPVDLMYFAVFQENQQSHLKWVTASEQNSSHFVIEHSTNGLNFNEIESIEAANHSLDMITYDFVHKSPKPMLNYYRLKQVDTDGKYTYSNIEVISLSNSDHEIVIRPNIAKDHILIGLNGTFFYETEGEIIDVMGRTVKSFKLNPGQNTIEINTSDYLAGYYFARLKFSNVIRVERFLKSDF